MVPAAPATFASGLLGRAREEELLRRALDGMFLGQGDLLLLRGEPGVGKSALARAVELAARERGALAYWGRCWEAGGGPAYWPLARALAPLLELDGAEHWVRHAGAALFDVLPEAWRLAPELAPSGAIDASSARFAVARSLASWLRRVSERTPLVLLIDDLHAADLASLELLEALAADAKSLRLLIIGTLRDRELDPPGEARSRLAALARAARVLVVAPLESGPARELLERHTGLLDDALARRVLDATRGNALFLVEVGRLLMSRSGELHELPLPLGVRESVRRRVETLPEATRAALAVFAVLGVEASPAIAAAVLALPGSAEVLDLAAPAEAQGILRRLPGGGVRFEHGLVRDALYHELEPEQRRALHASIAAELERRSVGAERATEIAHHLLGAGSPARERACRAAALAAEAAIGHAAYDDAVAVLERARAEAELELAPAPRTELLIALGRARLLAGDLEAGRSACRAAAALAERQADAQAMARAALALGSAWQFGLTNAEVSGLSRRALALLGESDPGLRARLLARRAAAEQPASDPAGPIGLAREAFALARSLGDARTLLDVLYVGISALMDYAPPDERRALNQETLALARSLGDRGAELRSLQRLALDHLELGELHDADAALAAQVAIALPLEHRRHLLPLAYQRAMRALFVGDLAAAEAYRLEAEALIEPGSEPITLSLHRFGAARLRADVAALGRMETGLFPGVTDPFSQSLRAGLRANIRCWTGELELSRAALAQALERPVWGDPIWCALLAEAASVVGDGVAAEALQRQLAPRRATFVCWGATGAFVDGPYSRMLGLLASCLGQHDEAVAAASAAIAECRAAGALPLLARSLLDAAGVLRRRARAGDSEQAGAWEAEATGLARSLGLCASRPLLDAMPGAPAALRTASPSAPSGSAAAPVGIALRFVREGDLWSIEYDAGRVHLRSSRGLEILAELVARPHQDVHVLDLARASSGASDVGDSGELLDESAKRAYRERLRELEQELEQAQAQGDLGRAEQLGSEREALAAELSRAFGLGGRTRRAGSAVERARVAVQRRVREAVRRIAEHDSLLGEHLEHAVRTGTTCSYRPPLRTR